MPREILVHQMSPPNDNHDPVSFVISMPPKYLIGHYDKLILGIAATRDRWELKDVTITFSDRFDVAYAKYTKL